MKAIDTFRAIVAGERESSTCMTLRDDAAAGR